MISLRSPPGPYDLALPYKVTMTVRPLTSTGFGICQAAARRRLDRLEEQRRERREAGMPADEFPDYDDAAVREASYQSLLIQELAVRHVVAWSGIEGDPEPTRETVMAVLDVYPMGERFYQEFTLRQVLLNAAKNGSGPSADGTSAAAEGQATAPDATATGSPARAEAPA